ncbi:hypothetical protein LT493_41700 [Streptomyces tricolor]|nr:hypothetical protein [Streptomyces tricolor]
MILTNELRGHPLVRNLAHSWDSRWYLHIATHGYGHLIWVSPQGAVQTDWAFFPLYPALIRALTLPLPLTPGQAALLIAWTAAGVAAYGIYRVGHHLYGRGVATALVALWGALPHAVELTIAYTESLFAALAAWSLYGVLKERWLEAGTLAALAGLSRPSGFAVAVAVSLAAGYEALRQREPGPGTAVGRRAPGPARLAGLRAVGGQPHRRPLRRVLHRPERLGLPLRLRRRLGALPRSPAAARRRRRLPGGAPDRPGGPAAVRAAVPGPRPAGPGRLRRRPGPAGGRRLGLLLLQAAVPAAGVPAAHPHGAGTGPDLVAAPAPGGGRVRRPRPVLPC